MNLRGVHGRRPVLYYMTWKEKRDQKGPFFDDHYGVMGELLAYIGIRFGVGFV